MPNLIIGSRGSKLALWQSNWVKSQLEAAHAGLVIEIEIIKTTGDKLSEASLAKIGGKGVFTKEIEEALLDRRVDLAVHSLKDLPTTLPDGLHIAAITEREDVRDALIVSSALGGAVKRIKELPLDARVGTSSLRRAAQLKHQRPDLRIIELRGNVETRLRKVDEGEYDAIILASAGLMRLGFGDRITAKLEPAEMLSAVGQGALGIETRIDDGRTNLLLEILNHWPTRHAAEAERAVLRELGGGCAVPIAALGRIENDGQLTLSALVADVEGKKMIRRQIAGSMHQGEELGGQLAETLIAAGARELLPRLGDESQVFSKPAPQPQSKPQAKPPAPSPAKSAAVAQEKPASQQQERRDVRPSSFNAIRGPISGKDATAADKSAGEGISVSASVVKSEAGKAETATPLSGQRVIVTRAVKQGGELSAALQKLGAEVIACPTIEIKEPGSWEQLDRALIYLSWYDWLVFTSANGVEYFLRRLDELGHGRAELMHHKICAIGRKTAEKLGGENLMVDLMPEKFTAEALVETFLKTYGVRQRLRGSRMLLPASRTTRDVIRPAMDKIGVYVEVVEAYQTVLPAASSADVTALIRIAQADYIVFTSPSTVTNLAALLETDHLAAPLARTRIACIGPVTAEAAALHGLTVHIQPEEHTGQAIVTAIVADNLKTSDSAR
ncbi:MAG: hydroxymethylbilane synthase [Blastocatellia bacterium]